MKHLKSQSFSSEFGIWVLFALSIIKTLLKITMKTKTYFDKLNGWVANVRLPITTVDAGGLISTHLENLCLLNSPRIHRRVPFHKL